MNIHEKINIRQNANSYNIFGLFDWVYGQLADGETFNRTRDICLFRVGGYHRSGKHHSQYPGFFDNFPNTYTLRYRTFAEKQMPVDVFLYSNVPYMNEPVSMHGHIWIN